MVEKFLSKDLREPKFVLNLQPVQGPSFRSLSLSRTHIQIHALTFSHSLSLCGTHSHALTFTNTHLLSLSLWIPHTQHVLSLSLSLSLSSLSRSVQTSVGHANSWILNAASPKRRKRRVHHHKKTRTGLHRVFINTKNFWRIKFSQRQCWRLQVRQEGRFSLTKVVPHVSLPLPSLIPMLHSAMTTDV